MGAELSGVTKKLTLLLPYGRVIYLTRMAKGYLVLKSAPLRRGAKRCTLQKIPNTLIGGFGFGAEASWGAELGLPV